MDQALVDPHAKAIAAALLVCLLTVDPSGAAKAGATSMLRKVLNESRQMNTDVSAANFLDDIVSALEAYT